MWKKAPQTFVEVRASKKSKTDSGAVTSRLGAELATGRYLKDLATCRVCFMC